MLAASSTAVAQDAGVTTTGALASPGDIGFAFSAVSKGSVLSDEDRRRYFNQAGCNCKRPVTLRITPTPAGKAKINTYSPNARMVVAFGENCSSTTTGSFAICARALDQPLRVLQNTSEPLEVTTTVDVLSQHYGTSDTTVADGGTESECTKTEFNQTIWFMIDTGSNGSFDQVVTQTQYIDLNPPPVPSGLAIAGGNEAIALSWTPLSKTDVNDDTWYYQLLCTRDDKDQVFGSPSGAQFVSALTLQNTVGTCPDPATGSPILDLNPKFVCSERLPAAVNNKRIAVLQNGIYYGAAVVAIDFSGNASALSASDIFYAQPTPSFDFFHEYKGQSAPEGEAQGGFCSVSPWARGSLAGLGASALVGLAILVKRRRRS